MECSDLFQYLQGYLYLGLIIIISCGLFLYPSVINIASELKRIRILGEIGKRDPQHTQIILAFGTTAQEQAATQISELRNIRSSVLRLQQLCEAITLLLHEELARRETQVHRNPSTQEILSQVTCELEAIRQHMVNNTISSHIVNEAFAHTVPPTSSCASGESPSV